jgi:hypothetical protein
MSMLLLLLLLLNSITISRPLLLLLPYPCVSASLQFNSHICCNPAAIACAVSAAAAQQAASLCANCIPLPQPRC